MMAYAMICIQGEDKKIFQKARNGTEKGADLV